MLLQWLLNGGKWVMTGTGHTERISGIGNKFIFLDLGSGYKDVPYNNSLGHMFGFCGFLNFFTL